MVFRIGVICSLILASNAIAVDLPPPLQMPRDLPAIEKKETWQQTLTQYEALGIPRSWLMLGPKTDRDFKLFHFQKGLEPDRTDDWSKTPADESGKPFPVVLWNRPGEEDAVNEYVDFSQPLAKEAYALAYARAEVDWPVEGEALLWYSDDGRSVVYLNNTKIFENHNQDDPRRYAIAVKMNAGRNVFKVKVGQNHGNWGFNFRLERNDPAWRIALLQNLLAQHPNEASTWRGREARMEIARQFEKSGKKDEALAAWKKAREVLPDNDEVRIAAEFAAERFQKGQLDSKEALAAAEKLWTTTDQKYHAFLRDGNSTAADNLMREWVARYPQYDASGFALIYRATMRMDAGLPEECRPFFLRAMREYPQNNRVREVAGGGLNYSNGSRPLRHIFETSHEVQATLEAVRRQLQRGTAEDIDRAVRNIGEVLRTSGGELVRVDDSLLYPRMVGAQEYVRSLLSAMSKDQREIYNKTVGSTADAAYSSAAASGEIAPLVALAEQFQYTPAAAKALNRAGNLHMDRGEFAEAAAVFSRLLSTYRGLEGVSEPLVTAKIAAALSASGQSVAAQDAITRLAKDFGSSKLAIGGTGVVVSDVVKSLQSRISQSASGSSPSTSLDYPTLNYSLTRAGAPLSSTVPEAGAINWLSPLQQSPSLDTARARAGSNPFACLQPYPVVTDGKVIVSSLESLQCIELDSGRVLWNRVWRSLGSPFQNQFGGFPLSCPTVANGRIYLHTMEKKQSALRAFYLSNGKPSWSSNSIPELKNLIWLNDPVVISGLAIAAYMEPGDNEANVHGVVALDATSGELRWRRPLETGRSGMKIGEEYLGSALQLGPACTDNGILYTATGLGSVAAVKVLDGSVVWISGYPRTQLNNREGGNSFVTNSVWPRISKIMARGPASPILVGDIVVLAPRDAIGVVAFSRETGEIRWRNDFLDSRYLAGVCEGNILAVDDTVRAIQASSGGTVWELTLPAQLIGSPAYSGGILCLPAKDALHFVDARNGKTKQSLPWDPRTGPLANLIVSGKHLVGVNANAIAALGPKGDGKKDWPLEEARALVADGKLEAAAEKFAQAASNPADALDAIAGRIQTLEQLNRGKDALGEIDRLLEGKPALLQSSSGAWRISKSTLLDGLKTRLGQPPARGAVAPPSLSGMLGYAWHMDVDEPQMIFAHDEPERFWVYASKALHMMRLSTKQELLWRNYVGLDDAAFAIGPTAIAIFNAERLTLIDRATGQLMWSDNLQTQRDAHSRDVYIDRFHHVSISTESVAALTRDALFVFDLKTGKERWWNKQIERRPLGFTYIDGKIAEVIGHGDQNTVYNAYDIRDGKVITNVKFQERTGWTYGALSPDGRLSVFRPNAHALWCIDMATGQKKWEAKVDNLEFRWEIKNVIWPEQNIIFRGENADKRQKGWTAAEFNPQNGALVREYPTTYERMGDNYFSVGDGGWGKIQVTRADIESANEWKIKKHWSTVFAIDPNEQWRGFKSFLSTKNDRVYVLMTKMAPDPGFLMRVFDWNSGALLSEEPLPGSPFRYGDWASPYKGRTALAGNLFLYTAADGVYAFTSLGDTQRDATQKLRTALSDNNLPPETRREQSRALAGIDSPTMQALRAPPSLHADGDWRKWELNEPLVLQERQHILPLTNENVWRDASDLSAKLYASWNQSALFIAVDVHDDKFVPPSAGSELSSGDSMRIAINSTPDQHRGFETRDTLTCSLALVDGRAVVSASGGQSEDGGARPRADVSRLPDGGMRYRLALPWALLRRDPARRPGEFKELRLGLAVFDNDGAETNKVLEWGAGVSSDEIFPPWLGQLSLMDVSRDLLDRYKQAIAKIPDTSEAMQFLRLIMNSKRGPRALDERIEELESFARANPNGQNVKRALLVLRSMYKEKGEGDPNAKTISFAQSVKCPQTVIDKIGAKENPNEKGVGLDGQYFGTRDLSVPRMSRVDAVVDFDFGATPPNAAIGSSNFSVRWTGQVKPLHSEAYTFTTLTDDGVRLWIDEKLLIDNWTDHPAVEDNGTIQLTAGVRHSIRMEYYQGGGMASAKLMWSSKSTPKQVIPKDCLFPSELALVGETSQNEADVKKLQAGYREAARLLADSPEGWNLLKRVMDYYPADAIAPRIQECETYLKEHPESGSALSILQTLDGLYDQAKRERGPSIDQLMQAAHLPRDARRAYFAQRSIGWSSWNVLGPVAAAGENRGMDLVMEPEKNVDHIDLNWKTKGPLDLPLAWTKVPLKKEEQLVDGGVDLYHWLVEKIGGPARQELEGGPWFAYAYRKVTVPSTRRATIFFGVNDTMSIWLNGKRIVKAATPGGSKDSQAVEVNLKQGENEILLKAAVGRGRATFYFRIADSDGRALDDLPKE